MKLLSKDVKPFLNALRKLTDGRFKFSIVSNFNNGLNVEMYFCNVYTCTASIKDLSIQSAFDCLIDLIMYANKQNNQSYFNKIGVSFEIYHNKLNGKNYYSFRKSDSSKWVKISNSLASYILECQDIEINGNHGIFVSYSEYETYFKVLLRDESLD